MLSLKSGNGYLSCVNQRLHAKSAVLLSSLESRLDRIFQVWLLLGGLICAARLALSPTPEVTVGWSALPRVVPYLLVIASPLLAGMLALRWFEVGDRHNQLRTRLAVLGAWRRISPTEARANPLYGTSGIMVSLLVGMLVNVPVRAIEYFAAMPPIPAVVPQWLATLHFVMTLDSVVFTSLYMIAFVAALRRAPLFPRLLVAIWLGDLTMQFIIAQIVLTTPGLPQGVDTALQTLLESNIKKVLISMGLWVPYLLLSRRVNVTYRHRVLAWRSDSRPLTRNS